MVGAPSRVNESRPTAPTARRPCARLPSVIPGRVIGTPLAGALFTLAQSPGAERVELRQPVRVIAHEARGRIEQAHGLAVSQSESVGRGTRAGDAEAEREIETWCMPMGGSVMPVRVKVTFGIRVSAPPLTNGRAPDSTFVRVK